MFWSLNLGGGGRTGAKYITTNANTNQNTGSKVTINSRAPEVPNDGGGDGRSYTYVYISCKNVTDRKYMTSAMLPQKKCFFVLSIKELVAELEQNTS